MGKSGLLCKLYDIRRILFVSAGDRQSGFGIYSAEPRPERCHCGNSSDFAYAEAHDDIFMHCLFYILQRQLIPVPMFWPGPP